MMNRLSLCGLTLSLSFASACWGQSWELGAAGGYGYVTSVDVQNATGSAKAGLKPGAAFGVVLGQRLNPFISGEIRYTARMGDLKLSGNGQEATFKGLHHAVHYDLLFHPRKGRGLNPFVAVGGGMKLYRGTGDETAYQPLSDFALLTKTQQIKPMISVGGGLAVPLSKRALLRVEVRDYFTPFPNEVIAPAPGASVGGWLHDIVPLVGLSYTF